MTRVRTTQGGVVSGTYRRFGITTPYSANTEYDSCSDEVLPGDGYGFSASHYRASGGILNSDYDPGYFGRYPLNLPVEKLRSQAYRGHLVVSNPTDGEHTTKLLARTNPSRPVVSLPNFIYELRELPELFAVRGRSIIGKAASLNLNYHFGWKPLLGDVFQMIYTADVLNKRVRRLQKLKKHGFVKSKISLGTYHAVESINQVVDSTMALTIGRKIIRETTQEVWGYVKYTLDGALPDQQDELISLAKRTYLGLYLDAATLWEAIPWSWFADYFGNIGDLLMANRNQIPCHPSKANIMRHTKTAVRDVGPVGHIIADMPWITYSRLSASYETKSRAPATPTLNAHLPFLTDSQASILGSLAALRLRY